MTIPTTWDKVTLENYYPFERTLGEENFKGWEELTQEELEVKKLDLRIKRACLLTDIEVEDALKMTMEQLSAVDVLIKTPYPGKVRKSFKFKGKRYKVLLDPRKWDAGRYQSIMNECRNKDSDNVHKLMYLVSVEVKNRFSKKEIELDPDEIEARINEFKQLPVSIANPIGVFFWNLYKLLTELTLSYSEIEMQKKLKMMKKEEDSLRNMAGL